MVKLSRSQLVDKLAQKAFKECDVDSDGTIDVKELHIGLLILYDKLNAKLPVHLKVPSHAEVQDLLRKHDADWNGRLDYAEFYQVVRTTLGMNEGVPFVESLPFKVVSRMAIKLVILPAAVLVLRQVIATAVGEKKAKKVPGVALGLAAEAAWKVGTVTLQR